MGLRNRSDLLEEKCFFLTTTCFKFLPLLPLCKIFTIAEDNLNFYCNKYKADILAYVLMPNHIHFIIYFREENKLSDFMRDFKKYTSIMMRKEIESYEPEYIKQLTFRRDKQLFKVWQDRFDDKYIMNESFLLQKMDYIHK